MTAGEAQSGDPNHPTAVAIRHAAAELFRERSPSSVSLRQIADRAGVNYGLIHHYFRTKEALLGEVFADFSSRGAHLIADAADVRDAMATFLPPQGSDTYVHMLGWAVLDGAASDHFRRSPAFAQMRALIERQWQDLGAAGPGPGVDARVVTATVMAAILGWRFFQPFLAAAGELENVDQVAAAAMVLDLLTTMIGAAAPAGP